MSATTGRLNVATKIGQGSYGKIYSGKFKKNPDSKEDIDVAIKRNLVNKNVDFIVSVREIEMLNCLRNHPCMVNLLSVFIGSLNDSVETPVTPIPSSDAYRDDDIYLIMKKATCDLSKLILSGTLNFTDIKLIMLELLLGVEYMHSKKIIHRDLKPANILWNKEEKYINVTDFGMSKYDYGQPNSPRVQTSWYRAPEVIWKDKFYNEKIDIWSLGCIFYELMTKMPLICCATDADNVLLNIIFSKIPNINEEKILFLINMHNAIKKEDIIIQTNNKSLKDLINLSENEVKLFNSDHGKYDDFLDLLSKLLTLNPNERISSSKAIEHKFFNGFKPFYTKLRKAYPPIPDFIDSKYRIINCKERTNAGDICLYLFNRFNSSRIGPRDRPPLRHEIFFHAMEIYDRFLYQQKKDKKPYTYKLGLDNDSEYNFFTCFYISFKLFDTTELDLSFEHLLGPKKEHFNSRTKNREIVKRFEHYVLTDVLKYKTFVKTPLEFITEAPKEKQINILMTLMLYCTMHKYFEEEEKVVEFNRIESIILEINSAPPTERTSNSLHKRIVRKYIT